MGAAAVVTRVLAQVEKFFDVDMPCLQVSADNALALAALIHRDGGIIRDLEKWNNAL